MATKGKVLVLVSSGTARMCRTPKSTSSTVGTLRSTRRPMRLLL